MTRDDKYLVDIKSKVVCDFLFDLLTDTGKSIDFKEAGDRMLGLVDIYGNLIFRFDSNYEFDKVSWDVLNRVIQMLNSEIDEYIDEGLIMNDKKEELLSFFEYMKLVFNSGKKIMSNKKVSFMAIPVSESEMSALYRDALGEKSTLIGSDGKKYVLNVPHSHKFFARGKSNKDIAKVILDLLEYCEGALKYGDDFSKVSNGGVIKSEGKEDEVGGTYVARNLTNKVRIQLHRVGDRIVFAGVYYKESKGTDVNKDPKVQEEYMNRKKALASINPNDDKIIAEGEEAYRAFKRYLKTLVYGAIINEVQEMRETMLEFALQAMNLREEM